MNLTIIQLDGEGTHSMRPRTYVFADKTGKVRALYRAHPSGMGAAQAREWAAHNGIRLSFAAWTDKVRNAVTSDSGAVTEFHDHLYTGKSRVFAS